MALAWPTAGVTVVMVAVALWLVSVNATGTAAATDTLTILAAAIVGAIVVRRQPRNSTGSIMLGIAFLGGVAWASYQYGYWALAAGSSGRPVGTFILWVATWVWFPAATLGIPGLLVRLPDGRRGSKWASVDLFGIVSSIAFCLSTALTPGRLDSRLPESNPFGLSGAEGLLVGLRWAGYVTAGVAIVAASAALWSRFRRSRGDEREQLKWITSAAALVAAALVYGLARQVLVHDNVFDALTPFLASTVAIPAAIGIAILKYRLYEIDLVINRTLVYGGLTAMLAGLYAFMVALTQRLVASSGQKSDIAILVTAFVGATAFTPVKNWLQRTVDQRFSVHDPASMVDSMREQIEVIVNVLDAQRIARRLVEDSASTYGARYVALALGGDGRVAPFHAFGDESAGVALTIYLHSRGKEVGVLSLSERRGRKPYSLRDRTALQLCADAVAEAISLREGTLHTVAVRPARRAGSESRSHGAEP